MAPGADPRARSANARPIRGARPIASGRDTSPRALSERLTAAKVPARRREVTHLRRISFDVIGDLIKVPRQATERIL